MKRTIRIDGVDYDVRYTYKREDGTVWHVLNATNLMGKFGDEWPEKQTVRI